MLADEADQSQLPSEAVAEEVQAMVQSPGGDALDAQAAVLWGAYHYLAVPAPKVRDYFNFFQKTCRDRPFRHYEIPSVKNDPRKFMK